MLGQPNRKAPQSDYGITRRSLVSRVLQTSAGALVAGSAASTIFVKANAQTPGPCQTCLGFNPGCDDFFAYSYCDDFGRFYRCCICGNPDNPIADLCDDICVQQQESCFRPAS
jgi:hypothetical protein